jgi:hypothetical protein
MVFERHDVSLGAFLGGKLPKFSLVIVICFALLAILKGSTLL